MRMHNITIKVPVFSLNICGEYSRFKKPSGLENLILTAIGTEALKKDTWREFFNRLAIPERMAPLFNKIIENLYDNNVLDSDDFDFDYTISDIGFTETGRDLFEQGRIKQEPKIFRETVFFTPYVKYSDPEYTFSISTTNPDTFRSKLFEKISYDPDKLRQFIVDNKSKVGADREDEILSVNLDSEPELLCTDISVNLLFDEVSGDFSFESDIDPNFIKGYFDAKDLLSKASNIFSQSPEVIPTRNSDIPDDWDSYRYQLPNDFRFVGKVRLFNPSECDSPKANPVNNMGYAFADIMSSESGRGYLFTSKNVGLSGLDGEYECTLLISRPLSPEEIYGLIQKLVEQSDIADPERFKVLLPLVESATSSEYTKTLIQNHLEKTKDSIISVKYLQEHRKSVWYPKLGELVEEAIVARRMPIEEAISLLRMTNIKIGCEAICKYYGKDEKNNLTLADNLLPVCLNKGVLTAALGIREIIARNILDGANGGFKSQELMAMDRTAETLTELKRIFGVESPAKINLSVFDSSQADEALKDYSAAAKGLNVLTPLMAGTQACDEIDEYMELFQNLTEVYCKDLPLDKLNGWMFGVGIRRKMENLLKTCVNAKDLKDMIDKACPEYIDKDTKQLFHDARDYGNKCAHDMTTPPVDNNTKKKWIGAINDFEKDLKTEKGKK